VEEEEESFSEVNSAGPREGGRVEAEWSIAPTLAAMADLPRAAKLAVSVRAAIRVHPAAWALPADSEESLKEKFECLEMASLLVVVAVHLNQAVQPNKLQYVAEILSKSLARGAAEPWVAPALAATLYSALAVTADDHKLDELIRESLSNSVKAAAYIGGEDGSKAALESIHFDLNQTLSWKQLSPPQFLVAARAFFARPLWFPEAPKVWASLLEDGMLRMRGLRLQDIYFRHRGYLEGKGIQGEETARLLESWVPPGFREAEDAAQKGAGADVAVPGSSADRIPLPKETVPSAAKQAPPSQKVAPATDAAQQAIRASLHMLSDQPLEDEAGDRLEFKVYANALAGMIDNRATSTPFTLAVNAPWGAGKSTLGKMVQRRLDGGVKGFQLENEHATCWFNAWMHDDAENLMAAFAGVVAREADRKRPWWWRVVRPIPSSLLDPHARLRRRLAIAAIIVIILLGLAPTAVRRLAASKAPEQVPQGTEQPLPAQPVKSEPPAKAQAAEQEPEAAKSEAEEKKEPEDPLLKKLLEIFPWLAGVLAFFGLMGKLATAFDPFAKAVAGFVQNPASASSNLSMAAVSEQLGKLIEQATPEGGRFVIFVDDLDRCKPPRAVDVLEVVNQLLNHEDVVVVLMADMPGVAACADIKYRDIAEHYIPGEGWVEAASNGSTRAFGRFYLQKIIQLQFDIPVHTQEQMQELVKKLASELPEPEETSRPKPVSSGGKSLRQRLKQSWDKEETILGLLRSVWEETGEALPVRLLLALLWLLMLPVLATFGIAQRFAYGRKQMALVDKWAERVMLGLLTVLLLSYVLLWVWWAASALSGADKVSVFGIAWLPKIPSISFLRMAGYLLTLCVLCGLLAALIYRRQKASEIRRSQKARAAIDGQIESLVKAGERDLSRIKSAIRVDVDLGGREEQYVDERIRLRMMNDSVLLEDAYEEVIEHLPALPRNAKRLLNRLRLLLYIAHEKKMFGGTPALTPRHIGKWAVLRERWPELAFHFLSEPEQLAELETLAAFPFPDMFYQRVKTLAADHADDPDLVAFFRKETRLGEVLPRIVHFESVATT
jgi:hypothetical protein